MRVLLFVIFMLSVAFVWFFLNLPIHARDLTGEYKNSPLHGWFEKLKSENGLCCSFADGRTMSADDWDIKDGHYRVFMDDHWIDIDDRAVVKDPNRFGEAVVWPLYYNGKVNKIHCFMPGSLM